MPGLTLVTLKPWECEPGLDGGDVLIGGAELLAKLLRREPLVIAGRAGRVQVADELLEGGLLRVAALEDQLKAVERHAVGRGSAVVGGAGQRMHGSLEGDAGILIDGLGKAGSHERGGGLRNERGGRDEGEGCRRRRRSGSGSGESLRSMAILSSVETD